MAPSENPLKPEKETQHEAGARTQGEPGFFLDLDKAAIHPILLYKSAGRSIVVGRGEAADVKLMDPLLSRQHFEFLNAAGQWQVRDLNSKNGTRLNGEPLSEEPQAVSDEDVVTAGTSVFVVEMHDD